jgi:hypothetical protein
MAEFKLGRLKYTWQGAWSAHSRYNPDDVVSYGGKVYTSLETHISNADFYNDLEYYNNDIPPLLSPKWELMTDGVSWLGEWTPETYYKVGDIVKQGGTVYLCAVAHTSQPDISTFDLDIQHWTVQLVSKNWAADWAVETFYTVNDVVRYGGRTYRCNTSHLSAGGINEGLEASSSYWDVFSVADDWKGIWTISTRYKAHDVVKFGGNVYRCEVSHTSAISADLGLAADQGKWSLVYQGIENVGSWQPSTVYKLNDVVKYGSYLYKATEFHTSGPTFAVAKFEVYCPGQEYDVVWDELTLYQPGDVVSYGGNLYTSQTVHTGAIPSSSTNTWVLLFQGARMRGDWVLSTEYRLGDVVRRGGNIYSCLLDNVGQDPDFLNDDSTTNSTYWDLIIPGIKWRGVWTPGETYWAGDTVVWVSSSYRCLDKHSSNDGNRPDDDGTIGATLEGRYWAKITDGNIINRLKNVGDIRTYGATEDGSTIGFKALSVGDQGQTLTSVSGENSWEYLQNSDKVYYVAEYGEDIPTAGTSPQSPWRTIRYATEQITGYATIFVRTGDYEEVLPIRVPAFVAVVGEELRSTTVKPVENLLDAGYIEVISNVAAQLELLINRVILEQPVGDEILNVPDLTLYGEVPQNFAGTPATTSETISVSTLLGLFKNRIDSQINTSITGTLDASANANVINAVAQITNNLDFIKNEIRLYAEQNFFDSTLAVLPARWESDIERIVNAISYDLTYPGNYKTVEASTYFINASTPARNKASNMFLMRDGSGLRNMTLLGLEGELGDINSLGTRRPTAGAFVSLDPGFGPSDTSAWVGTKSPYVQNVTNFGTGCIGFKIDGDLHGGGNQTMVSNDFTQVLSDGIGVWANGTGRTECVSVFTYYNHIGYLATNGGKIRGTNGNCSYGTFGAVSESYNTAETPITASVNNRYYEADVYQTIVGPDAGLQKLFFGNAGTGYSTGTMTVTGSGINASLTMDEFRDGGIQEIRIANPGDSSAEGGSGYVFVTNSAQGGDATRVQLAGSDENTASIYRGMRLLIGRGTGTGQYGYVADYDFTGKYAYIGKESMPQVTVTQTASSGNLLTVSSTAHLTINDPIIFSGTKFGNIADTTVYYVKTIPTSTSITISASSGGSVFGLINGTGSMTLHSVGWEHLVEGTTILSALDSSSNYFIEPRITISSPGFTTTSSTMPANRQWTSVAAGPDRYVVVALDTNVMAYSINGTAWTQGTMPAQALWTKVKYVGGLFMAFATGGQAARSIDGITWNSMTMPASTSDWRDVTYGAGKWVAVAGSTNKSAYSTDGSTWTLSTLPEGADWNSIEYGKGKFVATAMSDSSVSGAATAYSTNGTDWTLGNITQGSYSLAYGNGRFVALSGGYAGATEVSISFDGITWTESTIQAQDWRGIQYAQGLFVAISTGSSTVGLSKDGKVWTYQDLGATGPWCTITFANISKPGSFLVVGGLTANSTAARLIATGRTAEARATVVSGRMAQISIWEPGSGYTSPPVMTITDPNNSVEVFTNVRIANGVIANPTILVAGEGYETPSTRVTIVGNGYKDQYQTGSYLVVENLTRIPGPGDNVEIGGINDYTYKLLTAEVLSGTAPNITARLTIAKDLGREESPEHGTPMVIRQLYSQVRLTGHDFLDMGLGNYIETNYPDTLNPVGTVLAPEDEVRERNGGRVFYTSTDQDGNFRVGELFAVEQATGTVTLNAQFFELTGLEELRIGGFTVGGSGVVIREFSTDPTFTADSNNIVPTQRAIKAYMNARVSGGGADAITGQITAGIVQIGPDTITTTTGEELIFDAKVNFRGGIGGTWLAQSLYLSSGG